MNISLVKLPEFSRNSPKVVLSYDKIRYQLDEKEPDKYAEFYWYAREFPRYYRYHIDNIEFRLRSIHQLYDLHVKDFLSDRHNKFDDNLFEVSISNPYSFQIYWEFEALLSATSSALDILARVSGLEFIEQTPVSINNLTKKRELNGVVDIFRNAKTDWIDNMKDIRDCFVHYTPIDSRPYLIFYKTKTMWKIWGKIPTNPNIRVADAFEFSKKIDLLNYSIKTYKNLMKLDKQVAKYIDELYDKKLFPKRIANLFFIGQRQK